MSNIYNLIFEQSLLISIIFFFIGIYKGYYEGIQIYKTKNYIKTYSNIIKINKYSQENYLIFANSIYFGIKFWFFSFVITYLSFMIFWFFLLYNQQ